MLRWDKVSDDETMLEVSGSLYGKAGEDFEKTLDDLSTGTFRVITLDLSMAIGITSPAIAKLLSVRKRLVDQDRTIRIKGCSEALYEVFKKIRLDTVIEITRQ